MTTLKNINSKKIVKGDLIEISSLNITNLRGNFNLSELKEVRIERVNTDNPSLRILKTFKDYYQLIVTYNEGVDISDKFCIPNTRTQRTIYKKV